MNAPVEYLQPTGESLADRIDALLPQMQCRRCGLPACRPYAEAVAGGAPTNGCPPGGPALIDALSVLTGRPALASTPGCREDLKVARIDETDCIGCVLCLRACPVDAIVGAPKRMHGVVAAWCTGCGLCVPPCPVDCIRIQSAGREWSAEDAHASRLRHSTHLSRQIGNVAVPPVTAIHGHSQEAKAAAVARALARARARRNSKQETEKP